MVSKVKNENNLDTHRFFAQLLKSRSNIVDPVHPTTAVQYVFGNANMKSTLLLVLLTISALLPDVEESWEGRGKMGEESGRVNTVSAFSRESQ